MGRLSDDVSLGADTIGQPLLRTRDDQNGKPIERVEALARRLEPCYIRHELVQADQSAQGLVQAD
jgi:hypothetical protein